MHGIHALNAFPSARIALRFGSAVGAFSSIPLFLIFYALLYTLDAYHWPLWILALFTGVGNPLFWMAYHFDFISCSHTDTRHAKRMARRNPRHLWHRQCMCEKSDHGHASRCVTEFEITYAPDRPELVFCEQCYQKEIV